RGFHVTGVQTCALPICADAPTLVEGGGARRLRDVEGRWRSSRPLGLLVDEGGGVRRLQGWANGNCGHCQQFPWSGSPVARRRGPLKSAEALDVDEGVGPLQGSASKLYVIQLGYVPYRRRYWNGDYSAWRWPKSSLNAPGRGRSLGFL